MPVFTELCSARSSHRSKYRTRVVNDKIMKAPHDVNHPSAWIRRFAGLIAPGGHVLDVACGKGRNTRYLLEKGLRVSALDIDMGGLHDLYGAALLTQIQADIESATWPLSGQTYDAVVVTNYLHRPILDDIVNSVGVSGLLLYETFAVGNEAFGRPRNPDYLLRRGELLTRVAGRMTVLAYEDLTVEEPNPAAIQRICARA